MVKQVFKTTSRSTGPTYIEVKEGQSVFREGDLGFEMYIITEGKVEIYREFEDGEKQLAVLEKGDFFGEISLLEELPRTASARALSDSKLLEIDGSTFDQMLRGNPEIAVRMMRKLSRRLRETDQLLKEALGSTDAQPALEEAPPVVESAKAFGPQRLVHEESGTEFFLTSGSETTIGRRDPVTGINPDMDITSADTQRSISRRHAKILRRGDKFFVTEEIGTTNGTFVNGIRVETGVPVEIHSGDEVRLGLVRTVFHTE